MKHWIDILSKEPEYGSAISINFIFRNKRKDKHKIDDLIVKEDSDGIYVLADSTCEHKEPIYLKNSSMDLFWRYT